LKCTNQAKNSKNRGNLRRKTHSLLAFTISELTMMDA
jgi:hypothetical protein